MAKKTSKKITKKPSNKKIDNPAKTNSRFKKPIMIVVLLLVLVIVMAAFIWVNNPEMANKKQFEKAIKNPDIVYQEREKYLLLSPKNVDSKTVAFVFYPGGHVDEKAYVASFQELVTKHNVVVAIAKMPMKLAVFDYDRFFNIRNDIRRNNLKVDSWFIGGHSLGGVMACKTVSSEEQRSIVALVLLASYCSDNISDYPIPVLSVSGTKDPFVTPSKVKENSDKIYKKASSIQFVQGMNHSQIGHYGLQSKDVQSDISSDKASSEIVDKIANFIDKYRVK